MNSTGWIQTARMGAAARLTLNRPGALNALSFEMIEAFALHLRTWAEEDSAVERVIVDSSGPAFSAGADVKAIRDFVLAGNHEEITRYFAAEYALDRAIADFPKPYFSIVDGIAFGGGMALAVHGSHCVVTDNASFAMPETRIGFFPDAGASYFLSRLPGALGLFLGLTGSRLSGTDAVHLGLASHYVERARVPDVVQSIAAGSRPLSDFSEPLPPYSLEPYLSRIQRCFSQQTLEEIFSALRAESDDWAKAVLTTLESMSPASLRLAFQSICAGASRSLAECLGAELEIVGVSTSHADFAEGVRAALVDRDRNPKWTATAG